MERVGGCSARPSRSVDRICFFFQAEDGIRDYKVTGVQTCALPIWLPSKYGSWNEMARPVPNSAVLLYSIRTDCPFPPKSMSRRPTNPSIPVWLLKPAPKLTVAVFCSVTEIVTSTVSGCAPGPEIGRAHV